MIPNNFNGESGAVIESGTTAITGYFNAITFISDTVFSLLTPAPNYSFSTDTISGITFPAGLTIYGKFTAFTLTSGSVIAYKL